SFSLCGPNTAIGRTPKSHSAAAAAAWATIRVGLAGRETFFPRSSVNSKAPPLCADPEARTSPAWSPEPEPPQAARASRAPPPASTERKPRRDGVIIGHLLGALMRLG